MWVLKVKVISWPWPKVIYIWKLKLAFLRNDWAIFNQILFCALPKYQVSVSQDHWSSGFLPHTEKPYPKLLFAELFQLSTDFQILSSTFKEKLRAKFCEENDLNFYLQSNEIKKNVFEIPLLEKGKRINSKV